MTSAVIDLPANLDDLRGSTYPRLFSKPLVTGEPGPCGCGCALTRDTSFGFAVIDFARDVLDEPLDPWQAWLVIHAGELLPDGRPRFRRVLVLVARQNGKTHLLKVLALFWMFVARVALIVGTSTKLEYAKESWEKVLADIRENEALSPKVARGGVREANGQECITTIKKARTGRMGSRYKISAANRKGGRSQTIDRLIADELREQRDWTAYNAAYNAMNAVKDAQAWFISNAGDDGSVVLIALRKGARGGKDRRLGLFEWSAPEGSNIQDPRAWVAANPNLGLRLDADSIAGAAATAAENGGEEEAGFKTEVLCMHVEKLDAAIDPTSWNSAGVDPEAFEGLSAYRRNTALCLDIAPDAQHATVVAAAVVSPGIIRIEVVAAWSGPGCTKKLRLELPALIAKVRPRVIGWFPVGPAAAVAADLGKTKRRGWPPRGVTVEEIRQDVAAVCMGFAEQVRTGAIEHPKDPLLDDQALGTEKLHRPSETWVFSRRGGGHCDGTYAAAGAVQLARTLPARASTRSGTSTEVADELARRRAAQETP